LNRTERRIRLKEKMKALGIPALLVQKKENIKYLSGFNSTDCSLVITDHVDYLLTDFRYEQAAREECSDFRLVLISGRKPLPEALASLGIEHIGIEEKVVSAHLYKKLSDALGGDGRLIAADGLVEQLRAIKDAEELEVIGRAESLCDSCFSYILGLIRPGITERQLAFEIEFFLRQNGASSLSFDTICVSGRRSALPHGMPSDKPLEKGDFVTLDFGCVLEDYCSDMTRTVAIGPVSDFQKEIYGLVLESQLTACKELKAGVTCSFGDSSARQVIEGAGYGKCFGHGLGHGVGLAVHEAPTLNPSSHEVLGKNMVVTIEPGIYIPGEFGVRIEDLVFITDSGIIIKSKSSKELIIL
jgi:Xaa-Pro aminopeptidase